MWAEIATQLRSTKDPMIMPDMLGYDGTDKPTDPAAYTWPAMTKDILEIVDTEQADKVISIGHDWGSTHVCQLYNYYPNRVVGLVNQRTLCRPEPSAIRSRCRKREDEAGVRIPCTSLLYADGLQSTF
jgi:pimeloyl-ACP methyl ester carboxylesterase